jgi:hypothetical protein
MSLASAERRRNVPPSEKVTYVVLMRGDSEVASWPLPELPRPDMSVIDELARLQLGARRHGYEIRLRDACGFLRQLVELAGLADVVTDADD